MHTKAIFYLWKILKDNFWKASYEKIPFKTYL